MTPEIPTGGFFVSKKRDTPIETLKPLFDEKAFKTIVFSEDNIVLAAFKEFEGQGLWHFSGGAVAYDTDLTNAAALKQFLDIHDDADDIGRILWFLYQKRGIEFVEHLRGSFGFALWDNENKSLIVATDPYGIRPVVYCKNEADYSAASRIRTLCIDPSLEKQINPDAVYHYLFFQAICSPLTIYKDVKKLEPGKGHRFNGSNFAEFTHYDIRYHPDKSKTENQWKKDIFDNVQ